MVHLNCFKLPSVLWLFPLRHFVSRNFDSSLSYCRVIFNGVLSLLVQFNLYIHPEFLEAVRFVFFGWIHLGGLIVRETESTYVWLSR